MVQDPALDLAENWQRDFPVCPLPFDSIGRAAGLAAAEVLALLADLRARDVLSRIGAAVRPNTIGSSTLAAMSVPAERLDQVAAIVSAHRSVNHNYEREHRFNLWFVVTAPDRPSVIDALNELAKATGCPALDLPIVQPYHIDLGFRLEGARRRGLPARRVHPGDVRLDDADKRLVARLEDGLDFVPRPYLGLAHALGCSEDWVMSRVQHLIENGVFSRFGCILRHRPIGFRSNAMAVWDVPDPEVDSIGRALAAHDAVTLCYRRVRRIPDWPYNLFAMIHGRGELPVRAELQGLARQTGLDRFPSAILFSRRCFKQDGARYFWPERGAA
ncbi:MAG: Lrp/AsnC family transcriptional regulator [Alphaproteobacteria bacterium]